MIGIPTLSKYDISRSVLLEFEFEFTSTCWIIQSIIDLDYLVWIMNLLHICCAQHNRTTELAWPHTNHEAGVLNAYKLQPIPCSRFGIPGRQWLVMLWLTATGSLCRSLASWLIRLLSEPQSAILQHRFYLCRRCSHKQSLVGRVTATCITVTHRAFDAQIGLLRLQIYIVLLFGPSRFELIFNAFALD